MTDPVDTPIIVHPSPIPEQVGLAFRVIAVFLGGMLVQRGWITESESYALGGALMVLVPYVWGLIRENRNKAQRVTMAEAAPNSVAQVKP